MQVRTVRQDAFFIEKQGRHGCGGLRIGAAWQTVPEKILNKGFLGARKNMTLREKLQSDPMLECSEGEPPKRGPGRPRKERPAGDLPLES